jgi:hypothetical protein
MERSETGLNFKRNGHVWMNWPKIFGGFDPFELKLVVAVSDLMRNPIMINDKNL